MAAAAGTTYLTIGTLADSAEQVGTRLAVAYRHQHPAVRIRIREADLTDPTIGLRAGLVDVALTRAPFDGTGISTRVLRSDPIGVVLRADDPLTDRDRLRLDELADRRWFRFPEGAGPGVAGLLDGPARRRRHHDGLVIRTAHECLQSVLDRRTDAPRALPGPAEGLTVIPLADAPPSDLVIAWNSAHTTPLIRSVRQPRDDPHTLLGAVSSHGRRPPEPSAGPPRAARLPPRSRTRSLRAPSTRSPRASP